MNQTANIPELIDYDSDEDSNYEPPKSRRVKKVGAKPKELLKRHTSIGEREEINRLWCLGYSLQQIKDALPQINYHTIARIVRKVKATGLASPWKTKISHGGGQEKTLYLHQERPQYHPDGIKAALCSYQGEHKNYSTCN
mmetsp:Transcript_1333/g.1413  ORF Transcript_1333/g.1413 Transcript_1333/m.1413 type:complete len:140 (+) Transcript_1333:113-532(+)